MYIVIERDTSGSIYQLWTRDSLDKAIDTVQKMFGTAMINAREERQSGQCIYLDHYYYWGETIVEVYRNRL